MKKIIGLLFLALLAVGGIFGYRYYNETYKSHTAYAVVPTEVPEKIQTVDKNDDEVAGYSSYEYDFKFVDAEGNERQMNYELSGENPTPLEPGSYVTAEISKKRITEGPNHIEKSEIPEKALSKLQ